MYNSDWVASHSHSEIAEIMTAQVQTIAHLEDRIEVLVAQNKDKPRSGPHHRRLFAWMKKVHENLHEKFTDPEYETGRYADIDRFRYYLMMKGGAYTQFEINSTEDIHYVRALSNVLKKVFIIQGANDTHLIRSVDSMNFDSMSQDKFHELEGKMQKVCWDEFDLDVEILMEQI